MSGSGLSIAGDANEFAAISAAVTNVVDTKARLPTLPFRLARGRVAVGQFTRLVGVDFVPVFQALAANHGDDAFFVLVIEPTASYFSGGFGFFPAFTVATKEAEDAYWDALTFSPSDDPTGEIGESADVIAIVGANQEWAIWGQRSWDLALLWAPSIGGWRDVGVPFVDPQQAVEDFAGYGTWGTRLDSEEVTAFVRNVEAFPER